jgi:small subunit ribosomal protein S29
MVIIAYVILYLIFQGFEHLDPFVPICVRDYNDKELESCLDYYIDRRWLQNEKGCTEEGRKELKFLCGMNPYRLMDICAAL